MKNHQDEVIGVLQLINRKRDPAAILDDPAQAARQVIPFSPHTVELVKALAGQAAVSIENSLLYEDIERLFEGFVSAAVTAIEQRDPTTSGHSGRVATMSVGLAETVDRAGDGTYAGVRFTPEQVREIRYASLLHDFGKVGVREQVLVKAKKLYPADLEMIRDRYAFILRSAQHRFERARADFLAAHGPGADYERHLAALEVRAGRGGGAAAAVPPGGRGVQPTLHPGRGHVRGAEGVRGAAVRDPGGRGTAVSHAGRGALPDHPEGKPRRAGAARNRESRHPYLRVPAPDPLDPGAEPDPHHRLRAPREARRERVPEEDQLRAKSRCRPG